MDLSTVVLQIDEVSEVSTTEEVQVLIPLTAATIDEFWSQVRAQAPDRLMGHLEKTEGVAILGPNKLELSFPQSYVLSRQFCERPETLGRIAELASKVAGHDVSVSVVASGKAGQMPAPRSTNSPKEPASRKQRAQISNDPFVQQALDIFGGTLIDAREIREAAGEER